MVVPQPASEAENSTVVIQPRVPGLQIAYAIDSDRTIAYIPTTAFDRWKMSVDDIHEIALANLIKKKRSDQRARSGRR